jgi:putative ABC transport system substrate-binding protein
MPVVGYLYPGAPEPSANFVAALRKGLSETGYAEGRNVAIEYRFAHNEIDRLPALAADLVHRGVAVIAIPLSLATILAAKSATMTIPIVFATAADPVQTGLVASLNRPGGNITGVSTLAFELGPKRVELLHELLPRAGRFAALITGNTQSTYQRQSDLLKAATSASGLQIEYSASATIVKSMPRLRALFKNRTKRLWLLLARC